MSAFWELLGGIKKHMQLFYPFFSEKFKYWFLHNINTLFLIIMTNAIM